MAEKTLGTFGTNVPYLASIFPHFRSQVNISAEELSKLTEKLKEMVGRFRV